MWVGQGQMARAQEVTVRLLVLSSFEGHWETTEGFQLKHGMIRFPFSPFTVDNTPEGAKKISRRPAGGPCESRGEG